MGAHRPKRTAALVRSLRDASDLARGLKTIATAALDSRTRLMPSLLKPSRALIARRQSRYRSGVRKSRVYLVSVESQRRSALSAISSYSFATLSIDSRASPAIIRLATARASLARLRDARRF